jgi:Viral BACON domain/Putative binding domain, N-terminal
MRSLRLKLMRCQQRFAIAALAAVAVASCSQTETSITAPTDTGSRCQVTATPTPPSFPPPGGQGSVTITTTRDCTWSVATDAAWVSISGNRTGQGDATVAFSVAANPVPSPRSAAIMVAGQSVAVSQQAAPCVFSLSRPNDTIAAEGGRLAVGVTTLAGCRWTAATAAGWIAIASGSSGDASGTVGLSVAANGGAARAGQVTIAGQPYTVNQAAASVAPPPPSPPNPTPTPDPGPPPSPPGPSPTPPPPKPAPPPPPAQHVRFDGNIAGLSGSCPNLSFSVDGAPIVTDGSTNYPKKVKCGDVRNGQKATGEGDVQPNGTIKATKLEVSGDDH